MVERRTGDDGSFLADGLTGSAPSMVFGTGRVCIEPDCSVKLSRYNSTEWCALHESPASTQRPYDTSTRQRSGRRRNSSSRRRMTTRTASNSAAGATTNTAATGVSTASSTTAARSAPAGSAPDAADSAPVDGGSDAATAASTKVRRRTAA